MRRAHAFVILALLAIGSGATAQDHACAQVKQAAGEVQAASEAMGAWLSGMPKEDIDYGVTPADAAADQRLKDALGVLVEEEMACVPASDFPDGGLVAGDLEAVLAKPGSGTAPSISGPGKDIAFNVKTRSGPHPLVGVLSRFDIACGGDSLLTVFSREGNEWRETLRLSGKLGKDVSSGWGDATFGLSQPDTAGRWFTVLLFNRDWCTSCWSGGLNYIVARPGSDPGTPRVLASGNEGLYRCAWSPYEMEMQSSEFEVHYEDGGLGPHLFSIRALLHFRVSGDQVTRLLPTADTPVGAVVWWINSKWEEAEVMAAGNPLALRRVHDALAAARLSDGMSLAIAECGDRQTIRVSFEPWSKGQAAPPPYFIRVRQPDMAVVSASQEPDSGCGAPVG